MADSPTPTPSFSSGQRWAIRARVAVSLLSVTGLLAMANYLSLHYFRRVDISSDLTTRLSPQTVQLARDLTNDVNVTLFFNPKNHRDLYALSSRLLKEYQAANPRHINVRTLNYATFDGEARAFLLQRHLNSLKDKDFVFFESGSQSKIVYSSDLSQLNINEVLQDPGKEFRRNTFDGELRFSAALLSVIYPRPMKVYFVEGHNEHNPEDTAPDRGYSKFADMLRQECNAQVDRLLLRGTNQVPADCQLLVVAGPRSASFTPVELKKIEDYLTGGGRLLALLNNATLGARTGIEETLAKWDVVVRDVEIEDRGASTFGQDLEVTRFKYGTSPVHPIVSQLMANQLAVKLFAPRMVASGSLFAPARQKPKGADAPNVEMLAFSSPDSVDKRDPTGARASFPLAVAVEQGSIKGVSLDHGNTRIVVIGDSLCFDNSNLDAAGNHEFGYLAVNWLLDRPQIFLAGLAPRPLKEYKLLVTSAQFRSACWVLLAGLPGSVLVIGGLVWLSRRR